MNSVLKGKVLLDSTDTKIEPHKQLQGDEVLIIYIEDISKLRDVQLQHTKKNGGILLGETKIQLKHDQQFPIEFTCDFTKPQNFDQLCVDGKIVVGAEIDSESREMQMYWEKAGPVKFQQNIELTVTYMY
ncbi:unnamed protein product [Didymodactylos carnosus]|uniref:Uncharacterized protein n=1 Tax=Didymodactylos carnosus TaxID=1234261 RepID=A0A815L1R2_9BILA|nr:unnamed protein product [Didymodactylos carnosus]CAF1403297.1 unnamed protein product [Didymodactylos carnosus]CAF4063973.1 unnamed protein product [Didymodactylos carnosus]CAF4296040.1 unnamed protein product [Didymodactylos carnosus]